MGAYKVMNIVYEKPEEIFLARIIGQAVEDVERLPKVCTDTEFQKLRNDLWTFFQSEWFFTILNMLNIPEDLKVWEEIRKRIWECTTHKPKYIRPERRKENGTL